MRKAHSNDHVLLAGIIIGLAVVSIPFGLLTFAVGLALGA